MGKIFPLTQRVSGNGATVSGAALGTVRPVSRHDRRVYPPKIHCPHVDQNFKVSAPGAAHASFTAKSPVVWSICLSMVLLTRRMVEAGSTLTVEYIS